MWLTDGWYERFALPLEPAEHGYGHTSDQVARVVVSGDLLLGSERADLAGAFSWEQQPVNGWMSLKGERHKISFKPELDLLVSPDLRLELSEEKLALSGKINVPYGRAKIRTMPQEAIRLADDVMVLDKPKPKRSQKAV